VSQLSIPNEAASIFSFSAQSGSLLAPKGARIVTIEMNFYKAFARYWLATLMVLLGVAACPDLARAQTSNGQAPRPFWNFAHNPNALSDIDDTVANYGNALEPDITLFPNPSCTIPILGNVSPSNLYVYHDATCPTRKPDTVEEYLDHVHSVVKNGRNIALIAFDIKTKAAQPDLVKKLHDAVLTHLNNGQDGVLVNILYSVGSFSDERNGVGLLPDQRDSGAQ
jgi:hypothetical protein